jgi:hypothetical protein
MLDVNTILSMAIKNGKDTIHKGHAEDASSSYFYGTPGYKLFFFNYNNKVRYINCCTQLPTHSIQ